jgi:hypothetical protein
MLRGSQGQKAVALGMSLAFCTWLVASALIVCPFLRAELNTVHRPCCPRTNAPPHCPLSQSLQDCPFYVTESKIGVTKTIQYHHVASFIVPVVVPTLKPASIEQFRCDRLQDTRNLHLRISILRI